ncbi:flagellar hook-length control protein FliK [Sphingoaurantiacus capsulatus]|uniref:Flagellar hook-length control protein FliK n=1 Tax=Sphingoaurantiacus capsulatus TaxID=1771310 RepID=A0ABV7XFQ3_9SPHN
MDVSALNLATLGLAPDDGAVALPGGAPAGDAFAKLLSGLGLTAAPAVAGELIPAEGLAETIEATPPVDPALVVPGVALLRTAAKAAKATPAEDAPQPKAAPKGEAAETAEAADTPTPDSLGLPPLLAALVAPTLSQAAAKPVETPLVTPPPTAAPPTAALAAQPAVIPALLAGDPAPAEQPALDAPVAIATPKVDAALAPVVETPVKAPLAANVEVVPTPVVAEKQVAEAAIPQTLAAPRSLPSTAGRAPAAPPNVEAASSEPVSLADRPLPTPLPTPTPMPLAPVVVPPVADLAAVVTAPTLANDLSALGSTAQPQVAQADLAVERQLEIARDGAWLDQLTKDIVRTASAEGNLRFRLNPENLGSLHVEVTQGQNGASVRLTADTEAARTIIADARPQLIAEAKAQGLRIAETHVDLSGQGQNNQAHSQAGQGGNRGRDVPAQEYLTSWKPESAEEDATPKQRSAAERYA